MNFKQTVKLSHFEGGLYALMVASTESFLFYYAVKQNISSFELALLATLPLAFGALAQMLIPRFVADKNLGSSIVWSMLLQVIGVIGILYTANNGYNFNQLLSFTCIHFIGGLTSTPLWIDWASKIIPKRNFRKYMANRSSYTWYLILFFYILIAMIAQTFASFNIVYVFLIGAIARLTSVIIQTFIIRGQFAQSLKNPKILKDTNDEKIPINIKKLIWIFIIMTSLFKMAVYISGPFYTPYMMNELKLSMFQFVILSSIPYFGRAIYFNIWARAGKEFGAFFGIKLSCLYISFIPIIWILTQNYGVLILTEILAGISWGGFELNQILMIQNFMTHKMKDGPRVLIGIHMAIANAFAVLGGIIGAFLLRSQWSFFNVFFISSILRFLCVFILIKLSYKLYNRANNKEMLISYLKKILPRWS